MGSATRLVCLDDKAVTLVVAICFAHHLSFVGRLRMITRLTRDCASDNVRPFGPHSRRSKAHPGDNASKLRNVRCDVRGRRPVALCQRSSELGGAVRPGSKFVALAWIMSREGIEPSGAPDVSPSASRARLAAAADRFRRPGCGRAGSLHPTRENLAGAVKIPRCRPISVSVPSGRKSPR